MSPGQSPQKRQCRSVRVVAVMIVGVERAGRYQQGISFDTSLSCPDHHERYRAENRSPDSRTTATHFRPHRRQAAAAATSGILRQPQLNPVGATSGRDLCLDDSPAAKPVTSAPQTPAARAHQLAKSVATEARHRLGANTRVIWFGSWVQGTAQPHSDIDLALDAHAPFSAADMAALRAWADDTENPCPRPRMTF